MRKERLAAAVVGCGRAGRARVRALEAHPRLRLAALVRRRDGPGAAGLGEVLEDPFLDVVILCTPNLLHEPAARAVLEHRKHLLVELPLAGTPAGARALLELARQVGRLAHVEHIELLSPDQRAQRERVSCLGRVLGGELHFTAGIRGWIGDARLAGSPALGAVARLHRLVDLFGQAEVRAASLARGAPGHRLEVSLGFPSQGGPEIRLVEERGVGLPRRTRWAIRCARGLLDDPPPAPPGALFERDLDHFVARLDREEPPYVSDERVLHVLGLVERIEALCDPARA